MIDDRSPVDFRGRSPIETAIRSSKNRRESRAWAYKQEGEWREEKKKGRGRKKKKPEQRRGEKKRRKVDRGLAVVATVKVELTPSCHV